MSIGCDGTRLIHVGCEGGAVFTAWLPGLPRPHSRTPEHEDGRGEGGSLSLQLSQPALQGSAGSSQQSRGMTTSEKPSIALIYKVQLLSLKNNVN